MIAVILTLVVIGCMLYLIENAVPMSPPVKTVLRVVIVVLLCLWLLQVFNIGDYPLPRLR